MTRRTAILVPLLAACLRAQPAVPNTPAGAAFSAWLAAFNSGNTAQVNAYFDKFEPANKARTPQMLLLRGQLGGFDLFRIDKSERRRLEALLKERGGEGFARVELTVKDSDPPVVTGIALRPAPRPDDVAPAARLDWSQAIQALDTEASGAAAKDAFSGAILVAKGGRIAIQKAYGLADREKKLPNTVDTQFRIGSMNKMFTAVAVLQLVASGKLDLAVPIARYLPDYPNKDLASRVTVRHLLTHTGGTGDIFGPEFAQHRRELRALADYVALYGRRGLKFEPGSQFEYSNYGFVLLGVLIERASGTSYYDYVLKHIFAPAGMRSTDSLPEDQPVAMRSNGYTRREGVWTSNAGTLPPRGTSAGGGYSTVGDLLRFAQALESGKLIPRESFDAMTTRQAGPGYGFGMGVVGVANKGFQRWGHNGGAPGMNGELRVYPRTGVTVAILANLDPQIASRLATFFENRMPLE